MKIKLDSPSRQEILSRTTAYPQGTRHAIAADPTRSGEQVTDVDIGHEPPSPAGGGSPSGPSAPDRHTSPPPDRPPNLIVDTWAMSPERDAYRERRLALALTLGLAVALTLSAWGMLKPPDADGSQWWARILLVLVGVLLVLAAVPYWSCRRAFRQRRLVTAATRVDLAIQRLAEPESSGENELPLSRLFELNRRQLDEYQEMTKKQQRSAFLLAQAASVAAFLALLTGVLLSFQVETASERYVVAGLSGLGALLSGFLAKTFFDSHRSANEQLNHYYLEPQRTGRILAAERLARYLQKPADRYTKDMVTQLLRWEMPSVNGSTPRLDDGTKDAGQRDPSASSNGTKA